MNRWLSRERAFKDNSQVLFWPLLDDFQDYAQGRYHPTRHTGTTWSPWSLSGARENFLSSFQGKRCAQVGWPRGTRNSPEYFGHIRAEDFFPQYGFNDQFSLSCWVHVNQTIASYVADEPPVDYPGHVSLGVQNPADVDSVGKLPGWILTVGDSKINFIFEYFNGYIGPTLVDQGIEVEADFPDSHGWHHVVLCYDGSWSAFGVRLYLDGIRRQTTILNEDSLTEPIPYDLQNATFRIGHHFTGTTFTLKSLQSGHVRLVRLYNRTLSANDVTRLYSREAHVDSYKKKIVFNPPQPLATSPPGLTCHLHGHVGEYLSCTLHLYGLDTRETDLPLMVQADPRPTSETSTTLFLKGSTYENVVSPLTLFINSEAPLSSWMPLMIQVDDLGEVEASMHLYVGGDYASLTHSAPLYLHNDLSGSVNTTTLFLKVDGTLVGGQEEESSFPLYLHRPLEESITLFVQAASALSENLTLYTFSNPEAEASLDLAMPQTTGEKTGSMKLYVHGW